MAHQVEVLVAALAPFVPERVVYIDRGGRALGRALATRFNVPANSLNIGYPLSRLPHPLLYWMAFPIKEVVYRLTRPGLVEPPTSFPLHLLTGEKILLVDDTASSGKTLRIAFNLLASSGARAKDIRVAVKRAGPRVRALVDAAAI